MSSQLYYARCWTVAMLIGGIGIVYIGLCMPTVSAIGHTKHSLTNSKSRKSQQNHRWFLGSKMGDEAAGSRTLGVCVGKQGSNIPYSLLQCKPLQQMLCGRVEDPSFVPICFINVHTSWSVMYRQTECGKSSPFWWDYWMTAARDVGPGTGTFSRKGWKGRLW